MYPTLARVHALAIGIMVDLACRSRTAPVPSDDLRERARLSISYFDKIAADLRRHDLMRGTREAGGGNLLGRPAMLISMRDIVVAMHTPLAGAARPRASARGDARTPPGVSTDLWACVEARQLDWLGSVTLESLALDWIGREAATPEQRVAHAERRSRAVAVHAATTPNSVFSLAATLQVRSAGRRDPSLVDALLERP